jgi:hypothetical protein
VNCEVRSLQEAMAELRVAVVVLQFVTGRVVVLRAELWSHFWPNCDCRDFQFLSGVGGRIAENSEKRWKCELRSLKFEIPR